ncbi:MAG TPA: LmeA family phospholipid-binding protein, partial [Cellulomonadaceae bacterium]|nr:LmeA family phospholipid-binding protein [Cellulomonadaceae bacterium]
LDGAGLGGVSASDVDIDAHGVTTRSPYVVQHALVLATLSPATVRALVAARTGLDLDLRTDGDTLIGTAGVLGLPASVTLRPQVTDGQIRLELVALTLAGVAVPVGSLPTGLSTVLGALVIPVDGLPAGVTVTGTEVVAGGVRATLTATDVGLTDLVGRSAG